MKPGTSGVAMVDTVWGPFPKSVIDKGLELPQRPHISAYQGRSDGSPAKG